MSLKLYFNKLCPFVHRAWLVALEKNIPMEYVEVPLGGDMPAWYAKINPRETVPALAVGDKIVIESAIIAEYLDNAYAPPSALSGTNPRHRSNIRMFQDECGDLVGSLYGLLFADAEQRTEKIAAATAALTRVEGLLTAQSDGPYFLGPNFTMADVHIVPFLDRFRYTLPAFHNFDPLADFPRLRRLLQAAEQRPSMQRSAQPAASYVEGYTQYLGREAMNPRPKLYVNKICPFADRAVLAAKLTGADVDFVEVPFEEHETPAWYRKDIYAKGTVPALRDGNHTVGESAIVVRYIADLFTEKRRLTPESALAAADVAVLADEFGGIVDTLGAVHYADSDEKKAAAKEEAGKTLARLDALVVGPFIAGAEPTFVDCLALPFVARFEIADTEWRTKAPKLAAALDKVKAIEGVAEMFREGEYAK